MMTFDDPKRKILMTNIFTTSICRAESLFYFKIAYNLNFIESYLLAKRIIIVVLYRMKIRLENLSNIW